MKSNDRQNEDSCKIPKSTRVVSLFLAAVLTVSAGCGWNSKRDEQDDTQQEQAGSTSYGGGGSSHYRYGGGPTHSSSDGTISSGSVPKGGIGSSAMGGGE